MSAISALPSEPSATSDPHVCLHRDGYAWLNSGQGARRNMAEGTVQSIEIPASPDSIFEVLSDLEAYPEWITAMRHVEILERDGNDRPRRVNFLVDAMIKEIAYDLDYEYEPPRRMSWTAVPGDDIRQMVGSYELTELEGGGTDVVYALMVEPEFKVPGFLRRQAEKQLISSALRGLKKRVEALSTG